MTNITFSSLPDRYIGTSINHNNHGSLALHFSWTADLDNDPSASFLMGQNHLMEHRVTQNAAIRPYGGLGIVRGKKNSKEVTGLIGTFSIGRWQQQHQTKPETPTLLTPKLHVDPQQTNTSHDHSGTPKGDYL
ncbi:hypothetical protein [Absidia glauca]|uniref:Uncharacterized protein n=1 Tax=Absidia glauca TaxID=4829 RepID=A0A168MQ85_ABSGL|nr:hypothetical protein [Absidia glauca]